MEDLLLSKGQERHPSSRVGHAEEEEENGREGQMSVEGEASREETD